MAKELPYYKHEPSEWLEGEIQACSDAAIVCFTNLRDGYWLKLGCISYAFALHKYCRKDASIIKELIDNGIIDVDGENIVIKFLDSQLKDFNCVSEKRKKAADKRWSDANALQLESKSNAIREEKSIEDKIKVDDTVLLKKEPKVKKIKKKKLIDFSIPFDERRKSFKEHLKQFEIEFGLKMVDNFFLYWAEKTKSGKEMRWEIQTTWETKLRLERWKNNNYGNEKTFGNNKTGIKQTGTEKIGINFNGPL